MGTTPGRTSRVPRDPRPVEVALPITVGQFVKAAGLAGTGGEAKVLVTTGEVTVNGEVELRRGHKLAPDDVVAVGSSSARVVAHGAPPAPSPKGAQTPRPRS